MKEAVNGHKPLRLTAEHIFVYNVKDYEHFAYSDLGSALSGLDLPEKALNDNLMSPDRRQQQEGDQKKRWENISTTLSQKFGIPKKEIDRSDVLEQFHKLSQERVDMLSTIRSNAQETVQSRELHDVRSEEFVVYQAVNRVNS